MRLLLHALTTPEIPTEPPNGLRTQALVRVDDAGLVAWATQFTERQPRFGQTDLIDHHQIISRLHEQLLACLPARFPTWVTDEDALHGAVRRRHAELTAALDAVRGQCELAVTVLWTERAEPVTPPEAMTPGRQYLLGRQQALAGSDRRWARALEVADEIERVAGADLVAVRRQVCPSAAVALSSALLAPRAKAKDLMARLLGMQDGVRILVNGPWPPYTFADTGKWEA